MQRPLFVIMVCALLLAACNNNGTPAPVVQNTNPTADSGANPSEIPPTVGPREYATGGPTVPAAGTIIPPATEDPNAGILYDSVTLNRTGGIQGTPLDITLMSDGTVTRNGATLTVSADVVKQISDMLDQIGFFGLQGVFQAAGTTADTYTYNMTVERGGTSRTITAQDGYIPPDMAALLKAIMSVGSTP